MKKFMEKIAKYVYKNAIEGAGAPSLRNLKESCVPAQLKVIKKNQGRKMK